MSLGLLLIGAALMVIVRNLLDLLLPKLCVLKKANSCSCHEFEEEYLHVLSISLVSPSPSPMNQIESNRRASWPCSSPGMETNLISSPHVLSISLVSPSPMNQIEIRIVRWRMGAEPIVVEARKVEVLLEVARYNDIYDLKSLASHGVSLNSRDPQGRTVFFYFLSVFCKSFGFFRVNSFRFLE